MRYEPQAVLRSILKDKSKLEKDLRKMDVQLLKIDSSKVQKIQKLQEKKEVVFEKFKYLVEQEEILLRLGTKIENGENLKTLLIIRIQ